MQWAKGPAAEDGSGERGTGLGGISSRLAEAFGKVGLVNDRGGSTSRPLIGELSSTIPPMAKGGLCGRAHAAGLGLMLSYRERKGGRALVPMFTPSPNPLKADSNRELRVAVSQLSTKSKAWGSGVQFCLPSSSDLKLSPAVLGLAFDGAETSGGAGTIVAMSSDCRGATYSKPGGSEKTLLCLDGAEDCMTLSEEGRAMLLCLPACSAHACSKAA